MNRKPDKIDIFDEVVAEGALHQMDQNHLIYDVLIEAAVRLLGYRPVICDHQITIPAPFLSKPTECITAARIAAHGKIDALFDILIEKKQTKEN